MFRQSSPFPENITVHDSAAQLHIHTAYVMTRCINISVCESLACELCITLYKCFAAPELPGHQAQACPPCASLADTISVQFMFLI